MFDTGEENGIMLQNSNYSAISNSSRNM